MSGLIRYDIAGGYDQVHFLDESGDWEQVGVLRYVPERDAWKFIFFANFIGRPWWHLGPEEKRSDMMHNLEHAAEIERRKRKEGQSPSLAEAAASYMEGTKAYQPSPRTAFLARVERQAEAWTHEAEGLGLEDIADALGELQAVIQAEESRK